MLGSGDCFADILQKEEDIEMRKTHRLLILLSIIPAIGFCLTCRNI